MRKPIFTTNQILRICEEVGDWSQNRFIFAACELWNERVQAFTEEEWQSFKENPIDWEPPSRSGYYVSDWLRMNECARLWVPSKGSGIQFFLFYSSPESEFTTLTKVI